MIVVVLFLIELLNQNMQAARIFDVKVQLFEKCAVNVIFGACFVIIILLGM